ncbi:MAG: dTDP-4-dehydrorhamnose 3,5-epimerase [Crocinitomicaceae bacterium]|nr:dTDP-4-dehydrorhamnose 3,5-epimerase [Crocinitomicaceae bacterium]
MVINETSIPGLLIFEPRIFADSRGVFFESFNQKTFEKATGGKYTFVQDNQSSSKKGVLRGLHFQNPPFAQGKLVRVIKGSVIDVAVDIRKNSVTYGQHVSILLSEENNKQFWIPPGFAHGFIALEENSLFSYKCTNYYAPQSEETILWNDPTLKIDWTMKPLFVSEKDEIGTEFSNFVSLFEE